MVQSVIDYFNHRQFACVIFRLIAECPGRRRGSSQLFLNVAFFRADLSIGSFVQRLVKPDHANIQGALLAHGGKHHIGSRAGEQASP